MVPFHSLPRFYCYFGWEKYGIHSFSYASLSLPIEKSLNPNMLPVEHPFWPAFQPIVLKTSKIYWSWPLITWWKFRCKFLLVTPTMWKSDPKTESGILYHPHASLLTDIPPLDLLITKHSGPEWGGDKRLGFHYLLYKIYIYF